MMMFSTQGATRVFSTTSTPKMMASIKRQISHVGISTQQQGKRQIMHQKGRPTVWLRLGGRGSDSLSCAPISTIQEGHKLNGGARSISPPASIYQPYRAFSTSSGPSTTMSMLNPIGGIDNTQHNNSKNDVSAIVQKIKAELKEVDANSDGRIDSEEFKELLRKHASIFSEDEIVELGELYYAGKGGGSVPIDDFLCALEDIVSNKQNLHPILDGNCSAEYIYRKTTHGYTPEELDITLTHKAPTTMIDKMAYRSVKAVRSAFDTATGWNYGAITKEMVMNRVIFLETIAAVPGMVAAIVRHFKSLRSMERDGGLMHVFLEEANNERMHLLSFIKIKDPSMMFRATVIASQFGFGSAFLLSYIASPKFCHRFVGYVEEEACATYTKIVQAIEEAPEGSELAEWRTEVAPSIARGYWKLGENGSILDLMYAVRADEAEHRDVNHACSELERYSHENPFNDPELKINEMLRKYVKDIMTREQRKPSSLP